MGCILCQDSCCLGHDNSFSVKHIQRESPISFQVLPRNSIPSIQELTRILYKCMRVVIVYLNGNVQFIGNPLIDQPQPRIH